MKRNCNLSLVPFFDPRNYDDGHNYYQEEKQQAQDMFKDQSESPEKQQRQQKLTIFYDGKVCVSDVTEIQARTILMLASQEMEDKKRTPKGSEPKSPTLPCAPSTGLSMKRSLERFLQKRKHRLQSTTPYSQLTRF